MQAEDLGSCYVVVDGKVVSALAGDCGDCRRASCAWLRAARCVEKAEPVRKRRFPCVTAAPIGREAPAVRCERVSACVSAALPLPPSVEPRPPCVVPAVPLWSQSKNVRIELIQYPKFNQQRCREELVFEYPNGNVVAFSQHVSAHTQSCPEVDSAVPSNLWETAETWCCGMCTYVLCLCLRRLDCICGACIAFVSASVR